MAIDQKNAKCDFELALAKGSEVGWANADEDSMLASVSEARFLADCRAINAYNIYASAKLENVDAMKLAAMTPLEINDMFWKHF